MIRAVVRNGVIHPLDSIPREWVDGFHVIVEDAASASNEELDAWYAELKKLGAAEFEPGEEEHMQAIMVEADEQAKAFCRRNNRNRDTPRR